MTENAYVINVYKLDTIFVKDDCTYFHHSSGVTVLSRFNLLSESLAL